MDNFGQLFPKPPDSAAYWNEPPFFKIHTTTKIGWMIRGMIFFVVFLCFASLLSSGGDGGARHTSAIPTIVLASAFGSALLFVASELPNFQRLVTLTDDGIACQPKPMFQGKGIQVFSMMLGWQRWNKREIKQVELLRPEEPGNQFSFGLMIVRPKYASARQIAVPTSVSLEEVAARVQSMGLPVKLSGWNFYPEKSQTSNS
jgi:hypothetical protein